ncbi:MAG: hypothetical protein L3K19_05745 [Thermoplasmata archaeon]|nr:hypothetical protein [Thermoplasmata archaeon]
MPGTIRIAYRHRYGCPRGDCPGHVAILRKPSDVDRVIRTLSRAHPESPVEVERVSELPA